MRTFDAKIFTSNGTCVVRAYSAGRYAMAHRSVKEASAWTVTHRATGFAFGPVWDTRDDALAVGRAVSLIVSHVGDAGTFGNGDAWERYLPGDGWVNPRHDVMVEFFSILRRRTDEYIDGMGRTHRVPITGEFAARAAAEAIRRADNRAWLRDGVRRYGHNGEG